MDIYIGAVTLLICGVFMTGLTLFISWGLDDDRMDKGKHDTDSDTRVYIPSRCRRRRGNNGHDKEGHR